MDKVMAVTSILTDARRAIYSAPVEKTAELTALLQALRAQLR